MINMQDAVLIVISLGLIGCLSPCMAADAGDPNHQSSIINHQSTEIVKSIEFEGNRKFKDHVLRERLGFELGDRLDPFLAEGGRQTITEVYRKIGYPFVEVSLDRDRLAEGHLRYRIDEGPRVQIGSVRFRGNQAFSSWTLGQVVKTTTKREWVLWPANYTEEAVDEDVERLREFYYNKGYLDYKISAETKFTADREKVHVRFVIAEGPVYQVAQVVLGGNTRFSNEQLQGMLELAEGDVYLKAKADRGARRITDLYREHGFVDARVRQEEKFTPDVGDNRVAVHYDITEGRPFRIGRIEVTGNETTKDKVVRRVLDEYGFTPGELYDAKSAPKEGDGRLEKYVQRVTVAKEVMIRPTDPPQEDPNRKDVRVNIEEGMTGQVRPGIAFSSSHGLIGQLIYVQQNFDLSDWPEDLDEVFHPWRAFRGGGQTLSVALEPGTRYSQYYVSFSDPYWRDLPVGLNVLGRRWERFRESYDEERLKGSFRLERRLASKWWPSLGFRAENVSVGDLDDDAPLEIREVEGDTQLLGVELGLRRRAVDDEYDPSSGYMIDTSYEQLTGDDAFGILEGIFTHYLTLHEDVLGRKTILATRVLAGTVVGDAPPFEKYYAGGTGQYGIRGFEYRGVSTRGLQTNVDPALAERKDPIGSDWIFLAGTEVVVPLIGENFGFVFFLDSGTIDTGRYRLSIGAGIEIKVPQILGNVPMRFELGFPLLKDDDDETQVFNFSGGNLFGLPTGAY